MSAGFNLAILGLRESGKTTYLAALWHLIEAGELPASLTAAELQPDREYLNRIRDSWLRFQEIGRTSIRVQETLSLILKDTKTGDLINITLPDLSGESLHVQWAMRKATVQYAEFTRDASGILLFIHPETVKKGILITTPSDENASLSGGEQTNMVAAKVGGGRNWTPELTPTQVQLVELLQFANWLRPAAANCRVTVIVSAWDLVRAPTSPRSWVESHLPLLFQYLLANAGKVPFRIYGVSALGGDLKTDLKKLQNESIPARRICVVEDHKAVHHDLTAPLCFLLGLDHHD